MSHNPRYRNCGDPGPPRKVLQGRWPVRVIEVPKSNHTTRPGGILEHDRYNPRHLRLDGANVVEDIWQRLYNGA
jgi:hypothetical protein